MVKGPYLAVKGSVKPNLYALESTSVTDRKQRSLQCFYNEFCCSLRTSYAPDCLLWTFWATIKYLFSVEKETKPTRDDHAGFAHEGAMCLRIRARKLPRY